MVRIAKKGQMSQAVIISIIILLLTAGILFYFIKIMPIPDIVDKEACHQSVLLRSQEFLGGVKPAQTFQLPLNCKTEEIEISITDDDQIKRDIANAMYDCWWMLGEGDKNFFGKGFTKDSYCTICSKIKFSDNVQKKIKEIKDFDFYLRTTQIPKKNMTYMEYFTKGKDVENMSDTPIIINTSKEYLVIYELIEASAAPERIAGMVAGGGVLFLTGNGIGGALAGFGAWHGAGMLHDWILKNVQGSDFLSAFNLIPADAGSIKSFGCESIESIP